MNFDVIHGSRMCPKVQPVVRCRRNVRVCVHLRLGNMLAASWLPGRIYRSKQALHICFVARHNRVIDWQALQCSSAANGLIIIAQVSVHGISIAGHWLRGVPPSLSTVVGSGAFPHLCALVCSLSTNFFRILTLAHLEGVGDRGHLLPCAFCLVHCCQFRTQVSCIGVETLYIYI